MILDPIKEQAAYLEIVGQVRNYVSLVDLASYLGSRPQNISGWINAKSVPTLKDFRSRLLELAYFLRHVKGVELDLPKWALTFIDRNPPALAPWEHIEEAARRPHYDFEKLTRLAQITAKHLRQSHHYVGSSIIIWGENCAGKSSLANALLGTDHFAVSPIPAVASIDFATSSEVTMADVCGFDGNAPAFADHLRLLQVMFNSGRCNLVVVLSAMSFSHLTRQAFLSSLRLLPVTPIVVLSKSDLIEQTTERDQILRYWHSQLANFRYVVASPKQMDETTLNELREAAGLVGTTRLKLVATLSDQKPALAESSTNDSIRKIAELISRASRGGVKKEQIRPELALAELGLNAAQIGALLLSIEDSFGVQFPDRDADLAIKGKQTVAWLAATVKNL